MLLNGEMSILINLIAPILEKFRKESLKNVLKFTTLLALKKGKKFFHMNYLILRHFGTQRE